MFNLIGFSRVRAWSVVISCVIGIVYSVHGQVANDDYYTTPAGTTLSVPAPGVLANDTGDGDLTATLATGPANGTLTLDADGSFTYTPTNNFIGVDGFTYQTSDGLQTSSVATVVIMVLPPGQLFFDNFSRPTNSGPIFPWVQETNSFIISGNWSISNQLMTGTSPSYSYGCAYYEHAHWTSYSVQAQVQFSSINAASAGIMGRLDPATGAHYAVWIYPEGSTEQFSPHNGTAVLLLLKYENWTNFTLMGNTVPLPGIGTGWNTLGLTFQGNQISAYFNGLLVAGATDDGSIDGLPAYTGGGIGLNMWTIPPYAYTFAVSNLVVNTNGCIANISIANDNAYNVANNAILQVPAPGILTNDTGNGPLTAFLVNSPVSGSLILTHDGGFSYTPTNGFTGMDSFTYQCTDGQTMSGVATVEISVTPAGGLFYDDFTRPANFGSIFPWVQESGSWNATNNLLTGTSAPDKYGYAYYENANWTNYSVQAQIQFSDTNAWGGGIGGRLDPASGAHYAAWIYPEGSFWGPLNGLPDGMASLQLIKFESWNTFSLLGSAVPLPGVGTSWHTVKLAFRGTNILAWFDGNQVANMTDDGSVDNQAAYANGGISLDLWTDSTTAYTFSASNVMVNPLMLNNRYRARENTPMIVNDPGVLGNDTDVYGTNLTVALIAGPTNGTVTLDTNGGFIYVPATNFVGTDGFTVQASDGSNQLGAATVSITVMPGVTVQPAPVVLSIGLTNDLVALTWNSMTGQVYRVQYCGDLSSSNWNDLSPDVTATGPTTTQTDSFNGTSQQFYRIRLLTP